MSAVISCPRCAARVSMPESAPSDAWVRCPLCRAEYQLREAMEFVPPALMLIDRTAGEAAEGTSWMAAASTADTMPAIGVAGGAEAATASEGDSIKFDDSLLLDEPAEIDLDSADTSGSGAMIGSSKSSGAPDKATAPAGGGGEDFFDNLMSDEGQASPTAGDAGGFATAPMLDEDQFRLSPREEVPAFTAADDRAEAATAVATAPRRKERKSHPLVMLVGVVGGGLTGIVLGYAILMWAFGKDPAGVANSLPEFLVPSSLKRSTIAQSNQPAPGGDGKAFPAFGSGDSGNGEDAMPGAADGDAAKEGDSDPFGVAGKYAEKSDTTEPQATDVDVAKEETKSDAGKRDPFGAVEDPLMKKGSEDKAGKEPAVDSLDSLTAPSEPTKTLINDPFADSPTATKSDKATKEAEKSDEVKTAPAKSDEGKKEESTTVEPTGDQKEGDQIPTPQQTTSRYPTEVGIVGPQVESRATDEDLQRALEAAKETTTAAMAVASDAPQADKNRVNGPHFVNLTKVADAITTLDVQPKPESIAEASTERARKAVETAVLEAVPDQTKFDELGKLSGYFFNSKAAKAGIVIAGTLKESKQTGEVFESIVETPANNVAVTVVSPMKLAEQSGQQVVVMGRLVEDATSIRGYEGSAKRTVWSVFAVEPKVPEGR